MTTPVGPRDAISYVICHEQMQLFLDRIAPELIPDELADARLYLEKHRAYIGENFIKYLGEDDAGYLKTFESFPVLDSPLQS